MIPHWRRWLDNNDRLIASAVIASYALRTVAPVASFTSPSKEPSTMNDTERAIRAKGLNAPRVTPAQIDQLMKRVMYTGEQRPGGSTSTFVHAFLDGKFHLATGHSACVDEANFDAEIGNQIALGNATAAAREKLWELEGYRLYCHLQHERDTASCAPPAPEGPYPLYESRKRVRAFKIGGMTMLDTSLLLSPAHDYLPSYNAPHEFYSKHSPQVGGYVVFYNDGYVSYSPAAAFDQSCAQVTA